ncbi:MAG TPA: hypothetical protein VK179_19600 [Bacteroidales bacterium]|nr:hypothetical protein [Bacteroidales bacterium]
MEKKGTCEAVREWINTAAAIVAIAAGIYGFCNLKSDNEKFRKQLDQTTKIAVAADSQVTELRKHTKILEDQYILNVKDVEINKSRYDEEIMPYFGFKYSQTIEDMADGGDWLVNIGNKAKILGVEYGKNNTYTLDFPKNTFIEKGTEGLYLLPNDSRVRKIDIVITMENMNGIKYKQRFYSDAKNVLFASKPVKIN